MVYQLFVDTEDGLTEKARIALEELGVPKEDWKCISTIGSAMEIAAAAVLCSPRVLGIIDKQRAWDLTSTALKFLKILEDNAIKSSAPENQ